MHVHDVNERKPRFTVRRVFLGALVASPSSALVYTHPTAEDLRKVLAERGVLARVADLIA